MTQPLTLPVVQSTEVSKSQSAAWLGMAHQKNILNHDLAKMELQAQGLLLPVKDSQDYKAIDEALASYRKLTGDMTATRMPFTNAVDSGIVQPLMAFEKRVKEDTAYHTLVSRSLNLRKAESDKVNASNQKAAEITRFKAHVENEFFRVAAEYRALLRKECAGQYEIALREKLTGDTKDIKLMLQTLAVPAPAKFNATQITFDEMSTIYAAVQKPDYASMYVEACKDLDNMFANFASDLANAEGAIQHQQQVTQLVDIAETKRLNEDVAINTLIATSETVVIDTPRIKKTLQVVIIESEAWAKSVMAAFIVNMPHLGGKIRVKSWANLTIGQMAVALGQLASETGAMADKLEYKEVEK